MPSSMLKTQRYLAECAALGLLMGGFALAASAQNNQSNPTQNTATPAQRVQNNPTAQNPLMTVPEDFAGL